LGKVRAAAFFGVADGLAEGFGAAEGDSADGAAADGAAGATKVAVGAGVSSLPQEAISSPLTSAVAAIRGIRTARW
jgi:hypothetical protein